MMRPRKDRHWEPVMTSGIEKSADWVAKGSRRKVGWLGWTVAMAIVGGSLAATGCSRMCDEALATRQGAELQPGSYTRLNDYLAENPQQIVNVIIVLQSESEEEHDRNRACVAERLQSQGFDVVEDDVGANSMKDVSVIGPYGAIRDVATQLAAVSFIAVTCNAFGRPNVCQPCDGFAEVDCTRIPLCNVIEGYRVDATQACLLKPEFVACEQFDLVHALMVTSLVDPQGRCWVFSSVPGAQAQMRDWTQDSTCSAHSFEAMCP